MLEMGDTTATPLQISDISEDGDEFLIEESSIVDEDTLVQRLKEFSYYLVEGIEENLNFCLKLLEERKLPVKPNSTYVTAISKLVSVIPKIGSGIGSAVSQSELMILNKIDKKKSKKLADLVYYYGDNKEIFRKLLIESAADVFCSFEDQFRKLTCNGGQRRAMQKLAINASDRIFNYFLDTEQKKDVTRIEITKGIIYGEAKRSNNRTVKNDETNWKTSKIYKKVGIVDVKKELFYKNKHTNPSKYGHRLPFQWENMNDIEMKWEVDNNTYEIPKYLLKFTQELLQTIRNYIMTKNPLEEAKLEQEIHSEEVLEEQNKNHEKVLKVFREHFQEVLDEMEQHFYISHGIQKENKNMLAIVLQKQDENNSLQIEMKSKLENIHEDVHETKESQAILVKSNGEIREDITLIKTNQEELTRNTDDIKQVVRMEFEEIFLAKPQQKLSEVLRKIDPIPPIKTEIHRVSEKLKENDPIPPIKEEIQRVSEILKEIDPGQVIKNEFQRGLKRLGFR